MVLQIQPRKRAVNRTLSEVSGHPDYGVPFGQDHIVPIFLATLAVQQKSPVMRFRSAREMLEAVGSHRGGEECRRLEAVRVLSGSPAVMDLFLWLS